ncbi:hypothetical protein EV177_009769 [Coemansia sp. RSA 1804]|nr:hypothetical protein EV177_009769 [Coemansia sp. RSA 1804]
MGAYKNPKSSCGLNLESLANIAMAEMAPSPSHDSSRMMRFPGHMVVEDDQESDAFGSEAAPNGGAVVYETKEKLRLECQRLEQLLAQSRAMLGSFE